MSIVIASYFALLAFSISAFIIYLFFNENEEPMEKRDREIVLYTYLIALTFIAGFSVLSYQFYTL